MKRLCVLAVAAVFCVGAPVQGIDAFSDDFGLAAGSPLAPAWSVSGNASGLSYTGTGQLRLDTSGTGEITGISRNNGIPGDFDVELHIDNFKYNGAGPNDPALGQFRLLDNTVTGAQFAVQVVAPGAGGTQIQFLPFNNGAIVFTDFSPVIVDISTLTDIDFRGQYHHVGGFAHWVAEYRLNNGAWTEFNNSGAKFPAGLPLINATGQSTIVLIPAPATSSMDIDFYSITPEPTSAMLVLFGAIALIRRRKS